MQLDCQLASYICYYGSFRDFPFSSYTLHCAGGESMFISMFIFLLFLTPWLSSYHHPSPYSTPLQLHFCPVLSGTALLFDLTVPQLFNVTVCNHQLTAV